MPAVLEVGTTAWNWDSLGRADALCEQAQVAERIGFHSFWLPEFHFSTRVTVPAPLLLLAAIAPVTQRIRLGTTSYLLPIRNPLLAAEEVAVLDRLCEGRLILGLGRGISTAMFNAFGVAARDKRKLFQHNLDVMRRAWRGEPIAEDDRGHPIVLAPLPLQQPSPPLWVAAFGPLALQQVASLGLPYLASPFESLDKLAISYDQYHRDVASAGLLAVNSVPIMRTVLVTDNAAQARMARDALAQAEPAAVAQQGVPVEQWAIVGDRHYARDKLAEYRERIALTHLIVRAGIPGISDMEQLRSHEALLDVAAAT